MDEFGRPEIEITPAMIGAGCEAYRKWNPEEDEIENMIAAVFFAMRDAATTAPRE